MFILLCTQMDRYRSNYKHTQTHDHWVGDTIQPSHPLSSPSPSALNLYQHQGLFKWVSSFKRYDNERWTPQSVGAQYVTGEKWRNNSRKNEEMEPNLKQCPVVDVTSDGSKVWCYKKQYCIGTWNVRSMSQGKLEVVKQEMARVNIDRHYRNQWTKMDWNVRI